ncbi:MAG: branched-chain amino acid ABC transporter permease [Verrucomicrobia bacterium]|nr:branched-chain amino acid ABC transporter permease [Verrucomicrobiota bacterium]
MSVVWKDLRRLVLGVVAGGLLILLPFYAGEYTVTTFVRIIYFGFLALSVGMLVGQAGMISLTQTAFFGLAGYVIGLLGAERGMPFPWRDLIAIAAVLVMALLFGLVAMRTHKIVFLMITLAFGQICWAFAQQNTSLLHGWAGIRGIRPPAIAGINFNRTSNFYWASLLIFALGILVLRLLARSSFGLALNGIRENPRRMAALGYPVYWIRVAAFLIAAIYAGIGGLLATYNTGIITPTTIQLSRTIWVLLMVILGGSTYFWGPVVGTAVAVWLDVLLSEGTERYNTVIGVIFVFVVLFLPGGILSISDSLRDGRGFPFWRRLYARKNSG